jgi:hypothetical protein
MFSVDEDKKWVYRTVAVHFGLPDAVDVYEAAVIYILLCCGQSRIEFGIK